MRARFALMTLVGLVLTIHAAVPSQAEPTIDTAVTATGLGYRTYFGDSWVFTGVAAGSSPVVGTTTFSVEYRFGGCQLRLDDGAGNTVVAGRDPIQYYPTPCIAAGIPSTASFDVSGLAVRSATGTFAGLVGRPARLSGYVTPMLIVNPIVLPGIPAGPPALLVANFRVD